MDYLQEQCLDWLTHWKNRRWSAGTQKSWSHRRWRPRSPNPRRCTDAESGPQEMAFLLGWNVLPPNWCLAHSNCQFIHLFLPSLTHSFLQSHWASASCQLSSRHGAVPVELINELCALLLMPRHEATFCRGIFLFSWPAMQNVLARRRAVLPDGQWYFSW